MRELVLTARFERAHRKLIRRNPTLRASVEAALLRMAENLEDPRLRTHRLSGELGGLFACSAAYDCRIVFAKQRHPKTTAEVLIDIGSHDNVY